jgi:hypothetical protein
MSFILARTHRNFWNNFFVMAFSGVYPWGSDIGYSSSACAKGAIAVVANGSLADYFAIHISEIGKLLAVAL